MHDTLKYMYIVERRGKISQPGNSSASWWCASVCTPIRERNIITRRAIATRSKLSSFPRSHCARGSDRFELPGRRRSRREIPITRSAVGSKFFSPSSSFGTLMSSLTDCVTRKCYILARQGRRERRDRHRDWRHTLVFLSSICSFAFLFFLSFFLFFCFFFFFCFSSPRTHERTNAFIYEYAS